MAEKPHDKILSQMRKKLLRMRQEVTDRQKSERENISGTARRQDGFDVPFQGDSTNVHVSIINSDKQQLVAIDRALKMVDENKYGLCLDCGNPIPLSRLEALPFATKCITCQNQSEKKPSKRRR